MLNTALSTVVYAVFGANTPPITVVTANASPPVDPRLAWAAVIGPVIVGLIASLVAWMKHDDKLPLTTTVITPTVAASPDPAVVALQEANSKFLAMTERHIAEADKRVDFYIRENGELRRQNGELLERNAQLQRDLIRSETEVNTLTSKVEVLRTRLDERDRRG